MTTYERPPDHRRTSMPDPPPLQPRQRSSSSRSSVSQVYAPNYDPSIPQQYLSPAPASRRLSVPSPPIGTAQPASHGALPYPTEVPPPPPPQQDQQPQYRRPSLSPAQAYPPNPPYAPGPYSSQSRSPSQPYPQQGAAGGPPPTGYFDATQRSPQRTPQRSPMGSPNTAASPNLHPAAAYDNGVVFDDAAYSYGGNGYSQRPRGYSTGSYPPPPRSHRSSRSGTPEDQQIEHRRHSAASPRRKSHHEHVDDDGRKHYHRKDKRPTYGDSVMLAGDTILDAFDSVKGFFSSKRN